MARHATFIFPGAKVLVGNMQIITDPQALAAIANEWRKAGNSIVLVPTMGYYHEGHRDLIRHGRKLGDKLIVSLFVNPAQFGPGEDLDAYPRDFEGDAGIAEQLGADVLFAPTPDSVYHADHATWVEVPELASGLCGRSRPAHFRGVCTIVLKLLLLSRADKAVFGAKDWQQQAIIRRMARDLNLPVEIVTRPTSREPDGLAMSSRNVYLGREEREQAPHIRKGLELAAALAANGTRDAEILRKNVLAYWANRLPNGRLDYLEVVHPETLQPQRELTGPAIMACAVRLGKARLIDNILLEL